MFITTDFKLVYSEILIFIDEQIDIRVKMRKHNYKTIIKLKLPNLNNNMKI